MKKAKHILKKAVIILLSVILYVVCVADRIITAPFLQEQPKMNVWSAEKTKYSIIRVVFVLFILGLCYILPLWVVSIICAALFLIGYLLVLKEQKNEN
jgi:uncharacterized membrane protein